MKKGWIVTRDYIDYIDAPKGSKKYDEVEVIGPRGCTLTKKELLKGHAFKMYDDDDNLYYTGYFIGDKNSEDGFWPLNHYGEPNAGCTKIFYKNGKGKWEML